MRCSPEIDINIDEAMRLFLHIGTHKTGTSALQAFLRRNEQALATKGIYYARVGRSKNSNALARCIARRRRVEAQAMVDEHIAKARGADIVILSAESFYAMTTFFHKFNNKKCDYWAREAESVELLRSILPHHLSMRLVAFFRRQDYFLESIYGQVIKSPRVGQMPIEEFRVLMEETLDYQRQIIVWNAVFPDCLVYTYEQAADSIIEFFLRNIIQLESTQEFDGLDMRVNMRMSREVLEYKRLLNFGKMSAVDRRMNNFACRKLAEIATDDGQYRQFLAPEFRAALLNDMAEGNALLSKKYGMKPFPALSRPTDWAPYPGLSAQRARELAEQHARIRRTAGYQIERSALLAQQFVQQRLPMLNWLIPLGRSLLSQYRRLQ